MAAFDKLPKHLRDSINYAGDKLSAAGLSYKDRFLAAEDAQAQVDAFCHRLYLEDMAKIEPRPGKARGDWPRWLGCSTR